MTSALAIDLGTVRAGVAVSDPGGVIASPLVTLERRDDRRLLAQIAALVEERQVDCVVVGLPLRLDGSDGENAIDARAFAVALSAMLSVPVELWDERFTTAEAERSLIAGGVRRKARKSSIDQIAATLLLQGWLQSRHIRSDEGR